MAPAGVLALYRSFLRQLPVSISRYGPRELIKKELRRQFREYKKSSLDLLPPLKVGQIALEALKQGKVLSFQPIKDVPY